MTEAMGAPTDDIVEGFERRHRRLCKRCQEYGAAKYRGAAVMTPKYPDITVQLVGQDGNAFAIMGSGRASDAQAWHRRRGGRSVPDRMSVRRLQQSPCDVREVG